MTDLDSWSIHPRRFFRAISHPRRVEILAGLAAPGAILSPSDFAEKKGQPLGKIAYHFRELSKLGLIEIAKEVRVRGSVQHFYRAKRHALFANTPAWEGLPGLVRSSAAARAWTGYMNAARKAIEAGAFDERANAHFSWETIHADQEAWSETQDALERLLKEMFEIKERAAERIEAGAESFEVTYGLGGFEARPNGGGGSEDA